jgi:ABC-2 type transport system ATP-binding protein
LALLNTPRLVILDELTQGLDPAARRDVWAAVRQLHEEGVTVLLVTHELDEAEALCDRVVVMRAGRVLDTGPPAELIDRHGRHATVRFGLTGPDEGLLHELRGVAGVAAVDLVGPQVVVHGDRRIIATVGAVLVRRGPVPRDLTAHVPDLEDALLDLLDGAAADRQDHDELTGARR